MSIDDKRGIDNVARALQLAIACGFRVKAADFNSSHGAEISAQAYGSSDSKYVFGSNSTLDFVLTINDVDYDISGTISAGSYTAVELAAALNADSDLNVRMEFEEAPTNVLRMKSKVGDTITTLARGDGDAHDVLYTERVNIFYPVLDFKQALRQYDQYDGDETPYCRIDVGTGNRRDRAIMMRYNVDVVVFLTMQADTRDLSIQLDRTANLLRDMIEDNSTLNQQVNSTIFNGFIQFGPLVVDEEAGATNGQITIGFTVDVHELRGGC